ncbi:metal ABC transporter ATP-binding protein [Niallia sp. NCCP-28]|uniref:metal ABC transporter ATP-binding protein n=1 Tax=Niallia sp. NCCP-28 TaxID=2934712 RepID=UPI002085A73F|nr:metal ABC transporter ATP-binding protein [Niallia sp. NCCP-28]GKU80804.1 manganese transport system ATP-binding protein MntB [Niallia sp. NCCP-28]
MEIIRVKDLAVSYRGNPALFDLSVELESGRLIGIVGPNGAGKSTFMKALLELTPKDKGKVEIFQEPVKKNKKRIAYVPQRSNIDWTFPITVIDTVLLGTYPLLGLFHRPGKKEKAWAYECLKRVGMEAYAKRQIGELSGGQQQRVFMARALAQKPKLYLLDEPFVGIDMASEEVIVQILKELKDEGSTVLVVHHDLSKVEKYFDDLVLLNKTIIKAGPVHEVFTRKYIMQAYDAEFQFQSFLQEEIFQQSVNSEQV